MVELPKFLHAIGNRGWRTRWWCRNFDRKLKYGRFAHAQLKICNLVHIYGRIAKTPASYRKSGSANTMTTSHFWQEVEIWPFFCMRNEKYAIWHSLIYGQPNRHIPKSYRKYGPSNTMVTSDFWPEVKYRRFAHSQWKNAQFGPWLWPNRQKLLHSSAMDLWTRLRGRYHVPQNVFLV